jgi:hypothetical protein
MDIHERANSRVWAFVNVSHVSGYVVDVYLYLHVRLTESFLLSHRNSCKLIAVCKIYMLDIFKEIK